MQIGFVTDTDHLKGKKEDCIKTDVVLLDSSVGSNSLQKAIEAHKNDFHKPNKVLSHTLSYSLVSLNFCIDCHYHYVYSFSLTKQLNC